MAFQKRERERAVMLRERIAKKEKGHNEGRNQTQRIRILEERECQKWNKKFSF